MKGPLKVDDSVHGGKLLTSLVTSLKGSWESRDDELGSYVL